ncbi:hypothetical protein E4U24_000188 [Claviceps purpurea]|nr:hypothetical protein E4U24_000188 [Claviceps purpurea]
MALTGRELKNLRDHTTCCQGKNRKREGKRQAKSGRNWHHKTRCYPQPSLADKVLDARDGSLKLFKVSLARLEESNQSQQFEPSIEHHFAEAGHRVAVDADINLDPFH